MRLFLYIRKNSDSWSWSLSDGQYKDIVGMNTQAYHTEMHEYREEYWLRAVLIVRLIDQLHSNTMSKTLSQSGRLYIHCYLGSRLCTGACWWGTFITGWVDPQRIRSLTSVRAWSCYMLSGLRWYYYDAHALVVNATICRGPWACVVCSVRCFACWESGGLLWDHGRRSI